MENITEMSDRAEQYYLAAKRWLADLGFFEIETDFLLRLQQDYFVRLSEQVGGGKLKAIDDKILALQLDMREAGLRAQAQLDRLASIAEKITPEDISYLMIENNSLSELMIKLNQQYQEVKKGLFTLVKRVMHESKLLLD